MGCQRCKRRKNEVYYTNVCTEVSLSVEVRVADSRLAALVGDNVCEGTMGVVAKGSGVLLKG